MARLWLYIVVVSFYRAGFKIFSFHTAGFCTFGFKKVVVYKLIAMLVVIQLGFGIVDFCTGGLL